jgi:hypothetical protein
MCITLLHAHFGDWSALETPALLPHLQCLVCTVHSQYAISSRVKMNRLQTVDVQDFNVDHLFHEWLDIPSLATLIVDDCYPTSHISLIHYFLPRIRHLRVNSLMIHPPRNPIPANQLRSLTFVQALGLNRQHLTQVIPLGMVEGVHGQYGSVCSPTISSRAALQIRPLFNQSALTYY